MIKIVCVDDEPAILKLIDKLLTPAGYQVLQAGNGEKALNLIRTENPDLVLSDITMPGLSGYDVLKNIREDEKLRDIPVVMISALHEVEDRVKALDAGCDDFISKPFDAVELLARVKSILKISYYRRQLEEKKKFEAVIDEISDGIAICSPDWIIKDSNASVLRYLNITGLADINLIEVIFKNYSVSIPKEKFTDSSVPDKIFDLVREETAATKALYLEAKLNAVKNHAGELSSIVFVLRDVTEIRKEEIIKQTFLSHISHKLRTPLMVISGYASLLQEGVLGTLNEKQEEAIKALSIKAFSLIKLVEKLLGFTTIYIQKLVHSKKIVELNFYLHSITGAIIKSTIDKKIEIEIDCPEGINLNVNRQYLDQIVENLIENAVKFNDKEIVKILVAAKKTSGKIEISVTDNGIGIPNEEYEHIFDKFYQVEKYITGQVDGSGIGLAIVKRLVEGLGGEIWVESKLGVETAFIFTLPENIP